jgi:hypothetical protein
MAIIKLDKEDIKTIKELIQNTTLIDRKIAEMFGVSRKHINAIRNKQRWNYDYGKETNAAQIEAINRYFEKH